MDLSSAHSYRLDWITSFVAVARHGGFSAAAKALHRSQPRISSHVGELEHVLGTRLFDRSAQPVALTPEGRALLPHAEEILARLDVFAEVAGGADGALHGEVRIGMYPSAAAFAYPALVRALRRRAPTVRVTLTEGPALSLEGALSAGEIDLALRPVLPLVRDDRLAHRRLWSEPLVAVVPRGHPLAGRGPVPLARLAEFPLVTIGEAGVEGAPRQFETSLAFADAGVRPAIAFETTQPQTLAALVRGGLGVGLTNALAVTTADREGVELLPVAERHIRRHVAVWWRADRPESPVLPLVREVIAALPAPSFAAVGEERDAADAVA
ncbi:LysR family transcriptional regulator [Streptomyces avicenniae]|uniref:LysR family transcriptional regulator n=1 Tax=Streptomyces avicenniae TaxID=500153 RepID=UPI00069BDC17|nr:LysR family transcriptional regulator [Streptomyces avicenniae]